MPVPIVASLAVPATLVVVHPASLAVAHVDPVNPLMQMQLHDRSALRMATPPFWQVIIPLHWGFCVPEEVVGGAGETLLPPLLLPLLLLLPLPLLPFMS